MLPQVIGAKDKDVLPNSTGLKHPYNVFWKVLIKERSGFKIIFQKQNQSLDWNWEYLR